MEHDGDIGKTGAEGDEKRRPVGLGGAGSILRRAAPRDENPAGDDDDHRRHCMALGCMPINTLTARTSAGCAATMGATTAIGPRAMPI